MFGLALLFVYVYFCPFSMLITLLGKDGAALCDYRAFVCAATQQTQNVSVMFLESCSLVASDLKLQKRFYNVLSDLCLEMSNIQKHVW